MNCLMNVIMKPRAKMAPRGDHLMFCFGFRVNVNFIADKSPAVPQSDRQRPR